MKFLFDKKTGLSVYGASILSAVVVIASILIGMNLQIAETIENPTEHNSQYDYYTRLQKAEAARLSGFFPKNCAACHTKSGSGPVELDNLTVEMLEPVIAKHVCTGYKFDKNGCTNCHADPESDPNLFLSWDSVLAGDEEHPEVTAFYESAIGSSDLEELKTLLTFEKRLVITHFFSLAVLILGTLSIIAFIIYKKLVARSAKSSKYLA